MRLQLLLALLSVSECISSPVVGFTGQSITLPCFYDIKREGERSICWNQGEIPSQACDNQLVATGEYKGNGDASGSRFQLLGRLDEGDVSMTILNLTEDDAGRYGCRVDISGWFNDAKHHFELIVHEAPQTTSWTEGSTESTTQQPSWTPDHVTTDSESTSPDDSGSLYKVSEGGSEATVVLVSVVLGLVALTTAAGAVVMVRRWRRITKASRVNTSVQFTSTSSTLQLESRAAALDNVYQMDESAPGGEYEYCP